MPPKCRYCNTELFFKIIDERPEFNETICRVTWYATCYKCHKHYIWNEVYELKLKSIENFEEEKSQSNLTLLYLDVKHLTVIPYKVRK